MQKHLIPSNRELSHLFPGIFIQIQPKNSQDFVLSKAKLFGALLYQSQQFCFIYYTNTH